MAAFERKLERGIACRAAGPQFANLYRSTSSTYYPTQHLRLGRMPISLASAEQVRQRFKAAGGQQLGKLVAADVFQLCDLDHPLPDSATLERKAAIVFAAHGAEPIEILPSFLIASSPGRPNIMRTSYYNYGIRQGTAVQLLEKAADDGPVQAIIEAAVSKPHAEIYVALRGSANETVLYP